MTTLREKARSKVMGRRLLTFINTHTVIKAERILREEGVPLEVIPTPKSYSSECGMSLLVDESGIERALEVLKEGGVEVKGIYGY